MTDNPVCIELAEMCEGESGKVCIAAIHAIQEIERLENKLAQIEEKSRQAALTFVTEKLDALEARLMRGPPWARR